MGKKYLELIGEEIPEAWKTPAAGRRPAVRRRSGCPGREAPQRRARGEGEPPEVRMRHPGRRHGLPRRPPAAPRDGGIRTTKSSGPLTDMASSLIGPMASSAPMP